MHINQTNWPVWASVNNDVHMAFSVALPATSTFQAYANERVINADIRTTNGLYLFKNVDGKSPI